MKVFCKFVLPLALTAALSLTACAPASGKSAQGSESASAPASSSEAASSGAAGSVEATASGGTESSSVSPALSACAQELGGLYGQDYTGSVYRDKEGDAILYDSSLVPTQVLGTAIADFDGNGQAELVAAVLNDDHSFRLELYEEKAGQVSKTSTLDLSEEWAGIPQIIGAPGYESVADFFTYDGETPMVGLEISQSAGVFVDGVKLDFYSVSCRNGTLHLDAHASTSGSDGVYSSNYMDELAMLGLFPTWDALFAQEHYVREYAANYEDFARITTGYTVNWKDANKWLEDGDEPLECSKIHFNSQEELSENTKAVRAAYQAPSEHAAALQKYESALVSFLFDRKWPDGTDLEEAEDGGFDFSQNHFAIADVDADGEPELIIQHSETFVAAQLEQVYHYEPATDSLRCELSVYPFCTYYDNGVVKSPAAHNHTPSEFWPFSFHRFDRETGEFSYAGGVYARDKDSDMDNEPFPTDVDIDGDGRVFYLNEDSPIDNAEFEEWEKSFLDGARELTLRWVEMDMQNLDDVMSAG